MSLSITNYSSNVTFKTVRPILGLMCSEEIKILTLGNSKASFSSVFHMIDKNDKTKSSK